MTDAPAAPDAPAATDAPDAPDATDAEPIDVRSMDFSCFGRGSTLTGSFLLKGAVHLHATCDGEVTMVGGQAFVLEDEGVLTGTFKGHDMDIFGRFEGSILSTGKVVIHGTAVVTGDVEAASLVIHPNANVNIKADTKELTDRRSSDRPRT